MAYKAPIWEDGKSPAISAENLNNLSQAAEGAQVLYGNSAPTSSTEGAVGQFYLVVVPDSDGNYPLYQCVAIANGSYTWRDTRRIPDSITSMLGIPAPGTINRALNVLANVGNLHVWRKTMVTKDPVPAGYTLGEVQNVTKYPITDVRSGGYTIVTKAYSNLSVDDAGNVSVDESSYVNFYDDVSAVRGKFIQVHSDDDILFIPNDANISTDYKTVGSAVIHNHYTDKYQTVTGYPLTPAGTTTDYLTSTDRNAYTEGTVGNTTITYLGQLGDGARIEVVSYVGTGTYGSSNPNSLTFGFVPKYVRIIGSFDRDETKNIFNEGVQNWNYGVVMEKVPTEFTPRTGFGDTGMYSKKSSDGKTLYWYYAGNAYDQYNGIGYRYYVLAIA